MQAFVFFKVGVSGPQGGFWWSSSPVHLPGGLVLPKSSKLLFCIFLEEGPAPALRLHHGSSPVSASPSFPDQQLL